MEPFLGEIKTFPYNFAPKNYADCNGQVIPIAQNTALFSLLGTTFGGNGTTTFGLPNLKGATAMSFGTGTGLTPRTMGESGGAQQVALTTPTMPAHTHSVQASGRPATDVNPSALYPASRANLFKAQAATANVKPMAAAVTSSGTGQPHNNLMPYLVIRFCIATQGIFPRRP